MKAASRVGLALWMAALLIAPAAVAQTPAASKPSALALATGEITGFYYPVGGAICRLVNKDRERHAQRCMVEPTAGSAANIAALRGGAVDLAVVQSQIHRQAFQGQGPFAESGAFADMRSLASLHAEALVVVAVKSAKMKSLKDLKGKRVNLGRPKSFQRLMAEAALAATDVDTAGFAAALEMDRDQQKEALCEGRLDVGFFSGLHPIPALQAVLTECQVEVVGLGNVTAEQLNQKAPYLTKHVLPAAVYDGQDKDLNTLAMKATLVTTAKLPDEAAYTVVKVMLDNFDAFKAMHPLLGQLDKADMAEDGLFAPLHPGAMRAYREVGIRP